MGERPDDPLEGRLWDAAPSPHDAPRVKSALREMAQISREAARPRAGLWTNQPARPLLRGAWGWLAAGALAAGGAALGFLLAPWTGLAGVATVFALPLAIPYAATRYNRTSSPGTSALGTALQEQITGFETYLRTAEADQLRFEEDHDIFARYLPWAILFRCADRWADICAEAARRAGLPLPSQPVAEIRSWHDFGQVVENESRIVPAPAPTSGRGESRSRPSSRSSSSGGSGGRSSSSSFSSGGGGGGTSVGSW